MSSDDTRRLLKTFGMAVTAYEETIRNKASMEQIRESEAEARARLREVTELIERLRTAASASST